MLLPLLSFLLFVMFQVLTEIFKLIKCRHKDKYTREKLSKLKKLYKKLYNIFPCIKFEAPTFFFNANHK